MTLATRKPDRRTVAELRSVDTALIVLEDTDAWREARREARLIHYATVAERPDIALHAAGRITSIANRRLRQLGGDAA